jgi:cold shock CspA family protein
MESGQRIFVHLTASLNCSENDVVIYEITKGPKGPSAMKVRLFKE